MAWSVTEAPTVMVADGLMPVVTVRVALFTVRGSQPLDATLLLLSPL